MAIAVVSGATYMCVFGTAPGTLNVTSQVAVMVAGRPAATIMDVAPMSSISPCGMCTTVTNPTVAAATAAALGVLTPQPCIPVPVGTWLGGKSPMISGKPGLANDAKLLCSYGGSLSIVSPGQTSVIF
ncbi:MAG: DUF4280 domain-containing protein [Clostridiales Family XIII bacterium]|jgi:hypothetical protein|nr:DUF4280 domain-containing protein [Clostridiales Family XIII bacterium]